MPCKLNIIGEIANGPNENLTGRRTYLGRLRGYRHRERRGVRAVRATAAESQRASSLPRASGLFRLHQRQRAERRLAGGRRKPLAHPWNRREYHRKDRPDGVTEHDVSLLP